MNVFISAPVFTTKCTPLTVIKQWYFTLIITFLSSHSDSHSLISFVSCSVNNLNSSGVTKSLNVALTLVFFCDWWCSSPLHWVSTPQLCGCRERNCERNTALVYLCEWQTSVCCVLLYTCRSTVSVRVWPWPLVKQQWNCSKTPCPNQEKEE